MATKQEVADYINANNETVWSAEERGKDRTDADT